MELVKVQVRVTESTWCTAFVEVVFNNVPSGLSKRENINYGSWNSIYTVHFQLYWCTSLEDIHFDANIFSRMRFSISIKVTVFYQTFTYEN